MASLVNHADAKKNKVPETVTGDVGSAKRNIIRRGGAGKSRKEGASGANIDDGSLYEDPYALDEEDPNFDSEEENGKEKIPHRVHLSRAQIGLSKLTLTAYKKAVLPIIDEFFSNGDFEDCATSLEVNLKLLNSTSFDLEVSISLLTSFNRKLALLNTHMSL